MPSKFTIRHYLKPAIPTKKFVTSGTVKKPAP